MQGFIHLLLEAYVSDTIGTQHLPAIRRIAGIQGPPLASQHYPDQTTTNLLQAISEYESVTLDDLLYQFGVYFLHAPLMRQHYHRYLESYTSARGLLEQVPALHQYLQNALPEASFPDLRCIHHGPDLLEIIYYSPRHLCSFLLGIIDGAGQYFNEPLEIREIECEQRGAPACRILVQFTPVRRSGPQSASPTLASTGGSGPQYPGSLPARAPLPPTQAPGQVEAKRQQEEDEDLLILEILDTRQAATSRPLSPGSAPAQPLNVALSLFEIAHWLTARAVPADYTRLSLIQRSLTRLAVQGFIESKLDPQATRQNTSSGVAALGGQGILAAQRYRITPAGQAWLNHMQPQRQGH